VKLEVSMNSERRGAVLRTAALILLLCCVMTAAAQFAVIGTATGSLDGEARTWYVLGYEGEDGTDATASLKALVMGPVSHHTLDIQAHAEERYVVAGTLTLTGTTFGGLDACPCALDESEVLYFPSSSMFEGVYQSIESEVVVESMEVIGDGVASVHGTFSAVLGFVENVMSGAGPDPDRTVEVSGEFAIDRMPYEAP
jgi:hypothetical protein